MGLIGGGCDRVVIRVVSENAGAVKENLEKSGIIYAEESEGICFSVLPEQREEDFHRAKIILLNSPPHS